MEEIIQALGRLEAHVEGVRSDVIDLRKDVREHNRDLTTRVERLERWRSYTTGIAAAAVAAWGWLMGGRV